MKAVFGVNITEDKHNTRFDGEVFISKRVPENQQQSLVEENNNLKKLQKKENLPTALRIVFYACFFLFFLGVAGVINGLKRFSLAQMYANVPELFFAIGICALIWLILALYWKKRLFSVIRSEDYLITEDHLESQIMAAFETLEVPSNAKDMDILSYRYKQKGNQISVKNTGKTTFINSMFKIYVADSSLCLANTEMRYSIPLKSIVNMKTVKKRVSIPSWNKETPFDKGEYKQYRISKNKNDSLIFKPYYSIEIHYQNGEYELLIPPYELPGMEELIKLTPVE